MCGYHAARAVLRRVFRAPSPLAQAVDALSRGGFSRGGFSQGGLPRGA